MPKNDAQQTAKDQPPSVPVKRPGVRSLKDLEDLRRLQAKLLKQFLAGEIGRDDYRTAVYGCGVLCQVMKALQPPEGVGETITHVSIVPYDDAEETLIREMNNSVMSAPEPNE